MTEKRVCDCGMLVKGISEKHLEVNIRNHKKSKKHKELMKIKEEKKK